MKLKQILKENSAYIHFDKAHPNAKPHTWGGTNLIEYKTIGKKEMKKFWTDKNIFGNKKVYFVQKSVNPPYDYLVGSQTYDDYKDSEYWDIEANYSTKKEAIKYAKQLVSKDKKGVYVNLDLNESNESKKPEKRKLLFGQADEKEFELTDEIKQKFLEAVKSFNKYGESIYREANLKEAMEEICEIGKLAEKIALSETDDWFDSVSVQRDVKSLNEDVKLFEKTCNEVNQLQQRLESCFESIGQRLGKYFEIQGNEEKPMHENKINRKSMVTKYNGIDINNLIVRNDFGSPVRKIDHLVLNQDYIIHEYGMNQWMGYMRYLGIKSGEHKFKSSYQNDEFDMSFTTAELNELIHDDDIYEQL